MKLTSWALAASLVVAQTVHAGQEAACSKRHMFVVSFDGMGTEVLNAAIQRGLAPELAKWRSSAMNAPNVTSIAHIKTLPNHASMVSGIEEHGVERNTKGFMGIGGQGPIKRRTTFEIAQANGMATALVTSKPKLSQMLNKKSGGPGKPRST
ncbi:MAG TPA: alkaline phosphatase family protein, partial [Bdellovibrionales bacterium]|nr:alkaline phosphatase family protein [Bdellovibrionales bacterium]